MKKNTHTSNNDFRQHLFQFLYGDGLKIDPNLNAEERKSFVRKKFKKIWTYVGLFFLLFGLYSIVEFRDTILQNSSFLIIILLFLAFLFFTLGLLDSLKLWLRNRKIDKMQKSSIKTAINNTNNVQTTEQEQLESKRIKPELHQKERSEIINKTEKPNHANDNINVDYLSQSFFRQLNKVCEQEPLTGAKMGAENIWNLFLSMFKEPDGRINAKTVLLWTSGLAGYACQLSAWEKARLDGKSPELFSVQTKDGKNFYMGEGINRPLLSGQNSIWNLAAGIYQKLEPSRPLPDITELMKKSISVIGNEDYKVWNEIDPYQMLKEYTQFWKLHEDIVTSCCKSPDEWPLLFGLVLQKALQMTVKVTPPKQDCLEMAMENALFTSKMDIIEGLQK